MYVERNIVACLCNYYCHGKAISITYFECVFGTLLIWHANHIFQHYFLNGTIFGKSLLNIKCVS